MTLAEQIFRDTEDLVVANELFQGCTMIAAGQLRKLCVLGREEATKRYATHSSVNLEIPPLHGLRILTDSESCRQSTARLNVKIPGIRTHL